jgi:hypothetical protein
VAINRERTPLERHHDDTRVAETFKREGPEPPHGATGVTVEERNDAAEDAYLRNVDPDEAIN